MGLIEIIRRVGYHEAVVHIQAVNAAPRLPDPCRGAAACRFAKRCLHGCSAAHVVSEQETNR